MKLILTKQARPEVEEIGKDQFFDLIKDEITGIVGKTAATAVDEVQEPIETEMSFKEIANKMAELSARLELKGHIKAASEVDDLSLRTFAGIGDWLNDLRDEAQSSGNLMMGGKSNHEAPVAPTEVAVQQLPNGFNVDTIDGQSEMTFTSASQIASAIKNRQTNIQNVVAGVEAALYNAQQTDSLAKIKAADFGTRYNLAVELAKKHGLLK